MGKHDIFVGLGLALFAVFGSCVKWLNVKDQKSLRLFRLVVEAASAAFTGMLIYFVYAWQDLNVYAAFCMAGIFGSFGVKGVDLIGKVVVRNINLHGLKDLDEEPRDAAERNY